MLRRALTVAAVVAALVAGVVLSVTLDRVTGTPTATTSEDPTIAEGVAGKVHPSPDGGVYWGWYRFGAPYDITLLDDAERAIGSRPAIVHWFQEWDGEPIFDRISGRALRERGIVPMVTWEAWDPPARSTHPADREDQRTQPRFRLARVAAGDFDAYITRYALAIRLFGGPVLLRPFHEMDGTWYPWGGTVNGNDPADFVGAWRHVHDIFQSVGATNVTWIWGVNHLSVPNTPENAIRRYWPGKDYVDWIGISGFNFGGISPTLPERTFDEVYAERYREVLRYGKPVMLAEIGVGNEAVDKPGWTREAFRRVTSGDYDRIAAVVWYDNQDAPDQDFRVDETRASLRAFAASVARPQILAAPAALRSAEDDDAAASCAGGASPCP